MTSTNTAIRRVPLHSWLWRHRTVLGLVLAGVVLAGLTTVLYYRSVIVNRFDGRRWVLPSRIYSDTFVLRTGDQSTPEALGGKLTRLLYQKQKETPERAGRFRLEGSVVEVFPRDFRYSGRFVHGFRARVEFAAGHVRSIRDASGSSVSALVLEPELLGSVFGEELEDRVIVRLAEVPATLKDAVLVTEDRDFYRHPGVSVKRTFGALAAILRGSSLQGGSTLTQQLVKNLYLSPERTLRRKATEAIMAVILDERYSKDEILEAYLNEIYLGRNGAVAITGVGAAARHYFGRDVSDLDLAESAMLAAMIKAPNIYAPTRNPGRAKQRRDLVLRLMKEEGKITEAAMALAVQQPVAPEALAAPRTNAPHFLDFVKAELFRRYGDKLKTDGLQIYTTLDVDLQQAGQNAVAGGLARLEKQYKRLAAAAKEAPLQGALIFLEPRTGSVKAFVGGRDYSVSQFNRVTQAHRQPGSLFKPFVFLAAFGRRDLPNAVTPATMFVDSPITVEWDKRQEDQRWTPRNYDGQHRGADVGAAGCGAFDQHPDGAGGPDGGAALCRRGGARGGDRLEAAALSVRCTGRLRDLAHGDRGRVRGLRQQRRARGAVRDRGRRDFRRAAARPQGDAARAGPAGRHRVPDRFAAARGRGPRHGGWGAGGRARRRTGRKDRHDERRPRCLVRGLLAEDADGDLGWLRRQPRLEPVRHAGRRADLRGVFQIGSVTVLRRELPRALQHRHGGHRSGHGLSRDGGMPQAHDGGLHPGDRAEGRVPGAPEKLVTDNLGCSMTARSPRPPVPIRIRGARTHNLKGISVSIPTGQLTVVTGVSGSGKSSLAFDTLYAEGQRRYAESLSTYARQFLERLDRPDVDSIEPVPPAIALEQKNGVRNARSTVGTQTEIYDSLRLLFAHGGTTFCPDDGEAAVPGGVDRAVSELCATEPGARVTLVAPLPWPSGESATGKKLGVRRRAEQERLRLAELKRAGFFRALSPEGETVEIGETIAGLLGADGRLPLVVGRFVVREESRAEMAMAVETAFSLAGSLKAVFEGRARVFQRGLHCPRCGRGFRDPTPPLFAFNSPLGACPTCQGFGRVIGVDLEKVIPDPSLALEDRPVAPWNTPAYESAYDDLFRACRKYSVRTDIPLARLSAHERDVLIKGRGEFYGVTGFFDWLETKRYKIHVRVLLARYRAYTLCGECKGARLAPAALAVRFRGRTIAELTDLSLGAFQDWVQGLELSAEEEARLSSVVAELRSRVRYMNDVGLDYLTLSRSARTLSGGEAQRIGLAWALGGSLTGTLYVLDEPTIGLHAADTRRLLGILRRLADRGNTVVVVEHDPEAIEAADHVIDLGPEARERGRARALRGDAARAGPGEGLGDGGVAAPPGGRAPPAGVAGRRAVRRLRSAGWPAGAVPPRRGGRDDRRRARAQPPEPDGAPAVSAASSPSPASRARASPRSCATS